IALYILNHKRERLGEIERRYGMRVVIAADDSLISPRFRIDRVRALAPGEEPRFVTPDTARGAGPVVTPMAAATTQFEAETGEDIEAEAEAGAGEEGASGEGADGDPRRRRRRRRGRGRVREEEASEPEAPTEHEPEPEPETQDDMARGPRRGRGRRARRGD